VPITSDQVRHIARLANLDFSEAEFDRFTRQLNAILEYVGQLNRLDTAAIEPTFHVESGAHALRDDATRETLPRDEALRNAPESGHGLFKVPKVIG
jgi:aspartyl-tRNA(Asn)/glutamyl-tRNA(Gln) amidotransferase subunit C